MNILITGAYGQLGRAICAYLDYKKLNYHPYNSQTCDITSLENLKKIFLKIKPNFVINCAAYTDVEGAENDKKNCFLINSEGPLHLARLSEENGSKLVHFSTDYVFDGQKNQPYKEDDATNPLNFYGLSKREGEINIINNCKNHIIVRTSWVFGSFGNNFLKTMLNSSEKKVLKIVDDQIGGPTSAESLAKFTYSLLSSDISGELLHFSNKPPTTWYKFAEEIFFEAKRIKLIRQIPELIKTNTSDLDLISTRPSSSILCTSKIENKINYNVPYWRDEVEHILNRMADE